ncbi:MAG: hypothetical protein U1C53_02005, partial [Candidatus Veblenbacteria bacterium]|nr:hypothetical protein [Candidatus Veblenbacteria bacterium]
DRIITKDVSGLVSQGKQYTLTFWAKRDSGAVQGGSGQTRSPWSPLASLLGAREAEAQALVVDLGTFTPTNEWAIYRLGPFTLNSVVSGGATLRVTGASKYFIDNIAFREVQDTFFVRKNSWATPSSCQIPQHLRCQQYRTRSNQPTYLTGFSSICRAEAVGCQALVDTRNSASPRALTASAGDQTVVVPADEAVFRVYDSKKACAAKFAGCRRVGEPQLSSSGEVTKWNDKFTVLDPDTFDPGQNPGLSPLCSSTQNRCQVFTDAAGVPNYFKDPQGQVCEYKLISSSVGYDWYKQGTTERCNLVANPSFELLSQGTPSDGVADEFTGWQQLAPNGGVNVLEAVASLNGQYWGSTVLRLGPVADGVVSAPFLSGANRLLA